MYVVAFGEPLENIRIRDVAKSCIGPSSQVYGKGGKLERFLYFLLIV